VEEILDDPREFASYVPPGRKAMMRMPTEWTEEETKEEAHPSTRTHDDTSLVAQTRAVKRREDQSTPALHKFRFFDPNAVNRVEAIVTVAATDYLEAAAFFYGSKQSRAPSKPKAPQQVKTDRNVKKERRRQIYEYAVDLRLNEKKWESAAHYTGTLCSGESAWDEMKEVIYGPVGLSSVTHRRGEGNLDNVPIQQANFCMEDWKPMKAKFLRGKKGVKFFRAADCSCLTSNHTLHLVTYTNLVATATYGQCHYCFSLWNQYGRIHPLLVGRLVSDPTARAFASRAVTEDRFAAYLDRLDDWTLARTLRFIQLSSTVCHWSFNWVKAHVGLGPEFECYAGRVYHKLLEKIKDEGIERDWVKDFSLPVNLLTTAEHNWWLLRTYPHLRESLTNYVAYKYAALPYGFRV